LEKLKLELIRWIADLEDRDMLEDMHHRMTELAYAKDSDTRVIGLTANGGDVIKSRFVRGIVQAEMAMREGEFLTLRELERQSENW
jgi:hypothetical protein